MEIKIERLGRHHDRRQFSCGAKELDDFLKQYAFQNQKNHISKTFVAVEDAQVAANEKNEKEVLGFYTLSTGQIHFDRLPKGVKHPKYPVSIARLARLAVDLTCQGKGVGGALLHDALEKIKAVSQVMGIFAVVVDAKDAEAKSFYERYGFVSLEETDWTLFLPMKVIDQL